MRLKRSAACIVATMAAVQAQFAVADTDDASGKLAIDRMVAASANSIESAVSTAKDIYGSYSNTRKEYRAKSASPELSIALGRYDEAVEKNGLERDVFKSANLGRDFGLSLGGAVGIAASGVLRATLDTAIEGMFTERHSDSVKVLAAAVRDMSTKELDSLKESASSGKPTGRFKDTMDGLLDAAAIRDPDARDAIQSEMLRLTSSTSEEQLRALAKLSNQQRATSQDARNALLEIQRIDSETKAFEHRLENLESSSKQAIMMLDEIRFDELDTAEKQADYLRKGGLAHMDPQLRVNLLDRVETQAKYDAVQTTLGNAASGLHALSGFVGSVLKNEEAAATLSQVADGIQIAQAAVTVFALFSGVGTPMAAMSAFGSLSGMFGGGSSPVGGAGAQLQAIQATLADMKKTLDQILTLQKQTLESLEQVHRRLDHLQESVDKLQLTTQEGIADVLAAEWRGIYSDCRSLLRDFYGGGGGGFAFPFQDPNEYSRLHFVDSRRLALFQSDEGVTCFTELSKMSFQPRQLLKLSYKGEGSVERRTGMADAEKRLAESRVTLASAISRRISRDENGEEAYLSAMLRMTNPSTSLNDLAREGRLYSGKATDDARLPCWWRRGAVSDDCSWAPRVEVNDGKNDYTNLLIGDELIHPLAVTEIDDYVLSFYPQAFVPANMAAVTKAESGKVDVGRLATALQRGAKGNGDKARKLLLGYLKATEVAVAQQALIEGDLLAALLARELAAPPIAWKDGALANAILGMPIDNGLPEECVEKWAYRPAGIAAGANAFLRKNPRIAELALRLLARESVYPEKASDSMTLPTKYELARLSEPTGFELDTAMGIARPSPEQEPTGWADWWAGIFDLAASTTHGRTYLKRGFQLHYAAVDGLEATLWVPTKRTSSEKDPEKDVCGGYVLESGVVRLPRGWSISAGGLVMSLPSSVALRFGAIDAGAPLRKLLNRKKALRTELESLVVQPDIRMIHPLYSYGLGQQARDVLPKSLLRVETQPSGQGPDR